jgi:prepilin-type N-terminal cleavage/methylation domain-containing protein
MTRARGTEAGFTLIELMISMTLTGLIMAGAFVVFTNAKKINDVTSETVLVNRDQSNAMDLIVRDLIQVGQGMPTSKVVSIPNGTGVVVKRPGPSNLSVPTGLTDWPAVLPGAAMGPRVGSTSAPLTDIITLLYADTLFVSSTGAAPTATVAANGASMTVTAPVLLEVGDIVLFDLSGNNTMQVATGVAYNSSTGVQTVQFATGDVFGLNNRSASDGTIMQLQATPSSPVVIYPSVSRLRMVTYYVDANRTPAALIRCVGVQCVGTSPTPGQVVAFGMENLQFSYDIVDASANPTNVKMTTADQAGTSGAATGCPCSTGQIRKANVAITMRSRHQIAQIKDFIHRTLTTQVSLRNLSFMDRYPET